MKLTRNVRPDKACLRDLNSSLQVTLHCFAQLLGDSSQSYFPAVNMKTKTGNLVIDLFRPYYQIVLTKEMSDIKKVWLGTRTTNSEIKNQSRIFLYGCSDNTMYNNALSSRS